MGNQLCCRSSAHDAAPLLAGDALGALGLAPYLAGAKALVARAAGGEDLGAPLTVVTGNEASDADSIVSAVGLAYSRALALQLGVGAAAADRSLLIAPVMSIPRAEFKLRTEAVALLEHVGVYAEDLVFADEVDLAALHAREALRLVLVDHNALCADRAALGGAVVEIVDHHRDEGRYEWVSGALRRCEFDAASGRALVASTCTLVAEEAFDSGAFDEQLCTALLGVVLLDSVNLLPAAGKVTPRDEAVVLWLREQVSAMSPTDLFEWLGRAKFDPAAWAELSLDDCLRYDYKEFARGGRKVGFAAMLVTVEGFLAKGGAAEAMEARCAARGLDALVVMSMVMPGGMAGAPRRQLLFFAPQPRRQDRLAELALGAELLQAAPLAVADGPWAAVAVGNGKASRKQVAPLVMDYVEGAEGW